METIPTNPLNTGNGMPATQATPAAPTINPAPLGKIMTMKKYIIVGVGVIAILIAIYMAYNYYTGISGTVNEAQQGTQDLNNKLNAPSTSNNQGPTDSGTSTTDANKLNDTVNQLKQQVNNTTVNDTTKTDSSTSGNSTTSSTTTDTSGTSGTNSNSSTNSDTTTKTTTPTTDTSANNTSNTYNSTPPANNAVVPR